MAGCQWHLMHQHALMATGHLPVQVVSYSDSCEMSQDEY